MSTFARLSIAVAAAELIAIVLHYLVIGRRRGRGLDLGPRTVRRFSVWSILLHLAVVVGFLTLTVTGATALVSGEALGDLPFLLHLAAAPLFALAYALKFVTWAEHSVFEPHDWEWVKGLGGYLGGRQDHPAGRLNAGQKVFFWSVGVLTLAATLSGLGRICPVFDEAGQATLYHIHRTAALLLVLSFVIHLYLATLANPGTLTAIVTGRVSADWARHHHPKWWERVEGDNVHEG